MTDKRELTSDQAHARVAVCRSNLDHYATSFMLAWMLFEHLKTVAPGPIFDPKAFTQWRVIAARDAGFTVYHFREALKELRDTAPEHVVETLDQIAEAFYKAFPCWENMRNVLGHASEERAEISHDALMSVVRARLGDRFRINGGGPAGGTIEWLSENRYFVGGKNGSIFDLEVSEASAKMLRTFNDQIALAFESEDRPAL